MTKHPTRRGRSLRLALVLAVLGMTQGCVNMLTPIGENKYDCNRRENPASPHCHSFKSVEASTAGQLPPSRYDQVMAIEDQDRLNGIAPAGADPATSSPPNDNRRSSVPASAQGASAAVLTRSLREPIADDTPVRVGPVVQRTWIKRHADGNDMLIGDMVVYKEIVPTHWAGFQRPPAFAGAPSASVTTGGVYPHRPLASTAFSGPSSSKSFAPPGNGSPANSPPPERSPFAQPGFRSEPGEMAPVPASPSGADTSLPQ